MHARLAILLLLFPSAIAIAQDPIAQQDFLEPYRAAAVDRWEEAILKLEEKNATESHPENSVLFIGSSSIRMWKTIVEDVAPHHPIQRGYGGAKFSDVAVYAERLIQPHKYRAMVVFVANDIQGKDTDRTVDQVEPLVRHIMDVSFKHQPDAPVLLIEITPTSSRFHAWTKIRQLNARLRDIALSTPHTYFIPTAQHFLHPDATPRDGLFIKDRLHLNRDGYRIWAKLVRRRLDEVIRLETYAKIADAAQNVSVEAAHP